jgi:formylglycine-generating enzyme
MAFWAKTNNSESKFKSSISYKKMKLKKIVFLECSILMILFLQSNVIFASAVIDVITTDHIVLILVEGGTFEMGSENRWKNERPVHTVTISYDYYISKYEVTYDLYEQYARETKSRRPSLDVKKRGQRPVEGVSWFDAIKFSNWLSVKEGLTPVYDIKGNLTTCDFTANGYRLPTEAEWEFAARGGNKSEGFRHAGSNNPNEVAWYADNSNGEYQLVGLKQPNELGIHDMNGNMWEWCWDWYAPLYYSRSPVLDPIGPATIPKQKSPHDPERSRRSGRWLNNSESITVSSRSADFSRYEGDNGIRLVRTR